MKVLSVVGARPQFVKLAPIAHAMRSHRARFDHVIVHTGQHYDSNMSERFFLDLEIPHPSVNLEVGSGSHGRQTGAMMAKLDPVLVDVRPDIVLVYGDTNSTLAGAICGAKMHLPVAHVEAGLRSFNRQMPEEVNRVLVDHACDILLAPTEMAMSHLQREGLGERSRLVGDVMADVCLSTAQRRTKLPLEIASLVRASKAGYLVATLHRAENTDDPNRLRSLVSALQRLPYDVLLVAHPRLLSRASALGLSLSDGSVLVLEPLGYPEMLSLVRGSRGVVTDSGGLQKEAFLLGVPCTTLRTETEWPETLAGGWNRLVPDPAQLLDAVDRIPPSPCPDYAPFGDGHAAEAVCDVLVTHSDT